MSTTGTSPVQLDGRDDQGQGRDTEVQGVESKVHFGLGLLVIETGAAHG